MAKLASVIKENISSLSKKELEKLVMQAAKKDKSFHDYLLINYFDKEYGEQDLFEKAKEDLEFLMRKSYRGRSDELRLSAMLGACSKRINEFSKVCKNRSLEADLIVYVLEVPFSNSPVVFKTCFTAFNYKVVSLLKKLMTIVQTKLHEDHKIDYVPLINSWLNFLRQHSSHLDYVYDLPSEIE